MIGLAPNTLDADSTLFMTSMGYSKFSVNYPAKRVNFDQNDSDWSTLPRINKHKIDADKKYWEVPLKAAYYEKTANKSVFSGGSKEIFFDTGTSFNMVPVEDIKSLMAWTNLPNAKWNQSQADAG